MSALGQLNPIDFPQLWDVVVISGVTSPGVIKEGSLGDWKRTHDFDCGWGAGETGRVKKLAR